MLNISGWIVRIGGTLALILGVIIWIASVDALQNVHMLLGILAILALWVMGIAQGLRGGSFVLALATFLVGLAQAIIGMGQLIWFAGSPPWYFQVLHLLMGLIVIGLGEMITGSTRRRLKKAATA